MEHAIHRPAPHRRVWALELIARLIARRRSAQEVARLDAHMLDDIGLTRDKARREAVRSIWDVPQHWSR